MSKCIVCSDPIGIGKEPFDLCERCYNNAKKAIEHLNNHDCARKKEIEK